LLDSVEKNASGEHEEQRDAKRIHAFVYLEAFPSRDVARHRALDASATPLNV
jgi:hypothetical protein